MQDFESFIKKKSIRLLFAVIELHSVFCTAEIDKSLLRTTMFRLTLHRVDAMINGIIVADDHPPDIWITRSSH